jgi:4-oxalocrotonate tautomerase
VAGQIGRTETRLAERIAKDVMAVLNYGEESVSIAMEEVKPDDWAEKISRPDIMREPDRAITAAPGLRR